MNHTKARIPYEELEEMLLAARKRIEDLAEERNEAATLLSKTRSEADKLKADLAVSEKDRRAAWGKFQEQSNEMDLLAMDLASERERVARLEKQAEQVIYLEGRLAEATVEIRTLWNALTLASSGGRRGGR